MATVLIIYSTTDGHTLKICQRIKEVIKQRNHQVNLVAINEEAETDLELFDKIVIGASIRYGKHRTQVYKFIQRNEEILNYKPNAFFSVNVVARKPGKNTPETNPYIKAFLRKTSWKPKELAVFAGKIDYQRYPYLDRQIIRLIMWLTNGPTHPKTVAEFTNWADVDTFALRICTM